MKIYNCETFFYCLVSVATNLVSLSFRFAAFDCSNLHTFSLIDYDKISQNKLTGTLPQQCYDCFSNLFVQLFTHTCLVSRLSLLQNFYVYVA